MHGFAQPNSSQHGASLGYRGLEAVLEAADVLHAAVELDAVVVCVDAEVPVDVGVAVEPAALAEVVASLDCVVPAVQVGSDDVVPAQHGGVRDAIHENALRAGRVGVVPAVRPTARIVYVAPLDRDLRAAGIDHDAGRPVDRALLALGVDELLDLVQVVEHGLDELDLDVGVEQVVSVLVPDLAKLEVRYEALLEPVREPALETHYHTGERVLLVRNGVVLLHRILRRLVPRPRHLELFDKLPEEILDVVHLVVCRRGAHGRHGRSFVAVGLAEHVAFEHRRRTVRPVDIAAVRRGDLLRLKLHREPAHVFVRVVLRHLARRDVEQQPLRRVRHAKDHRGVFEQSQPVILLLRVLDQRI